MAIAMTTSTSTTTDGATMTAIKASLDRMEGGVVVIAEGKKKIAIYLHSERLSHSHKKKGWPVGWGGLKEKLRKQKIKIKILH